MSNQTTAGTEHATLCSAFQDFVTRTPQAVVLRTPGNQAQFTWKQWNERVRALAAGLAALAGGALAGWFSARELALTLHWTAPGTTQQVRLLQFHHWEFLFAVSFLIGFYVLHRLSRIQEGEEHSERVVVQQFVLEAFRSIDQLSPIDGLRTVILFPFGRLRDRRIKPRP